MSGMTYGQGAIDILKAKLTAVTAERDALAVLCAPGGLDSLKAELAGAAGVKAELASALERLAAYEALAEQMGVDAPPHTLADVDAALGQALRAEPAAVPPAVSQAMAEADRLLKQYHGRSDTMPSAGAQPAEAGAIEGEPKRDVEVEISRREGQRPTVYDRTKSDKKHR